MALPKNTLAFSLALILAQPVWAQTETLNTSAQVPASSPSCFSANVPIYCFTYNVTGGTALFTGLNGFTTSGTYLASDIINFKLYQTNFSVFNTSNLLATITTGLGPGAHSFPAFSYSMTAAVTRYFWITVDLTGSASGGRTITGDVITAAMTTITGTENYGTNTAGGTQTFHCTLPVELQSFSGWNKGNQNHLEWKTASESNNDFFTLERSADGALYQQVIFIKGSGNTNVESTYAFTDEVEPGSTMMYYRLTQTDFNGSVKQLGEAIVVLSRSTTWKVYPNPCTGILYINSPEPGIGYMLLSVEGKILATGVLNEVENRIDLSAFSTGVYVLVFDGDLHQQHQRIVVE